MDKSEKIEIAIAVVMMTLLAMGWFFFWVKPHDEMVFWIMDCTAQEDMVGDAKEIYEQCHKKFLIHKGISPS